MPWFKVDDGFAFHPKAIMAGNSALGLWVRAGAWCGANLTDGALPRHMIGTFGAQARDAKKLCAVGLWVETEDGYQFHEWGQMQPTKAEVEAERAANRARQKDWRDKKRNGVTDNVTNAASNAAPSRPVPTRPVREEAKASSDSSTDDFMDWYLEYPRKASRAVAEKAYAKARKTATAEQLLEGAKRYAADPNREQEFTKLPATWLNGGCWDDGPLPARGGVQMRPTGSQVRLQAGLELMQRAQAKQERQAGIFEIEG